MPTADTAPQPRPDNLFGVCAALGEDWGVNPLWLRVALGAGVLWNPQAVLGIYAALGLLVLATRLAFPDRKPDAAPVADVLPRPEPANADGEDLARAA